jgi:hypothetical protein
MEMKQLSKTQNIILLIGALLMAVGACSFAVMFQQKIMCWVYLFGALLFVAMQVQQKYEGTNFAIKRLRRIVFFSHLLFILAGLLMADTVYFFLKPLFSSQYEYITFVYNKWVVLLMIAAIVQLYTTHRISSELKKE